MPSRRLDAASSCSSRVQAGGSGPPADNRPRRHRRSGGRGGPIDYANPREFPRAERLTRRRREQPAAWVIGRFVVQMGRVMVQAIRAHEAHAVDEDGPLTETLAEFYRWRTRQGAHQWLRDGSRRRAKFEGCEPLNLASLLPKAPAKNGRQKGNP